MPVTKFSLVLRMKERVMLSFQSRLRNIHLSVKDERTSYANFAKPVTKYSLVLRMKERVMLSFQSRLRNIHLC